MKIRHSNIFIVNKEVSLERRGEEIGHVSPMQKMGDETGNIELANGKPTNAAESVIVTDMRHTQLLQT